MIRYPQDPAELAALDLDAQAEARKNGWLARAAERIGTFKTAGRYNEKKGIWSEIKPAYMDLQHDKCAYCERQFSKEAIEHDLEHFRPKSDVQPWPDEKALQRLTDEDGHCDYTAPLGAASAAGYYLLAYHTGNYCASCKVCNTIYKLNYFPVAAARTLKADSPAAAETEQPLLLYPLGALHDAPEKLIRFEGVTPVPVFQSGPRHLRARVTIDFFNLDCREDLLRERARCLVEFARAYKDATAGRSARERKEGEEDVALMRDPASPHANCVRCFHDLLQSHPARAAGYLKDARVLRQLLTTSQR